MVCEQLKIEMAFLCKHTFRVFQVGRLSLNVSLGYQSLEWYDGDRNIILVRIHWCKWFKPSWRKI